MVCGAGHSADVVHVFLMSSRPAGGVDLFHAKSRYVWFKKSEVNKGAACSSTSLELNLITVDLGSSKPNSSNRGKLALDSQSTQVASSTY